MPTTRCGFDDRGGVLGRDWLVLNGPTVERFQLLEGRTVERGRATLPGGDMDIALGSVADVIIGGHRFEPLSALFPLESGGAFDDPYSLGNLGQDCLKPFRAVFDYRHRRIALIERIQGAATGSGPDRAHSAGWRGRPPQRTFAPARGA